MAHPSQVPAVDAGSALEARRAPQSILCLDAGISTGYSYWEAELVDSGVAVASFGPVMHYIPELQLPKTPELVVMEITKPHFGKLGEQLQIVQREWLHRYPHLMTIQPWEWKTTHNRRPLPRHCKTQHERDAIRMGLFVRAHTDRFAILP
jgi:hypothetical protein